MFGKTEYVGLSLQDDAIRVARLSVDGNDIKLVKLDRFSLVERVNDGSAAEGSQKESEDLSFAEEEDADDIFGLYEDDEEDQEEIDLESLEADDEDALGMDMMDEAETPQSNELLLYNILTEIDSEKVYLGLNVPAGHTIFQVIRDTDFNEVKQKDLIEDLESKLESIYGMPKSKDNYSYEVREDGSLLLASIEDESTTLQLVNSARELYSGKLSIENIVPDEIGLVGLVRSNYSLEADEITGIIQFGKEKSRVTFMKGEEVWLVSPIINEGTNQKSFLNTIFSKILFQLDTGEVPNLDRILLANNTKGEEAVEFFRDNFPDIHIENLTLKDVFFDTDRVDPSSIPSFTTAIGSALAASGATDEYLPKISFVPKYVVDRQKIFKLQWHGMLILFFIFLAPITFNYFYTQNAQQINSLSSELDQMNSRIEKLNPVVNNSNELESNLTTLREKLTMLDTLTEGSREWSAKLSILNDGIEDVGSTWITSFSEQSAGGVFIQGHTLYRNRIPDIVNIFEDATLMNVNNEEIREQQVYSFAVLVKEFTDSDSLYSPPTPKEVENLIAN